LKDRKVVNGVAAVTKLPDCPYAIEYHHADSAVASSLEPKTVPLNQVHSSNRHYFTASQVPVKLVRELQSSTSSQSTLHVELDISSQTPSGLSYQTADNLGILPINRPEVVESVAQSLGYELDQVFSLKPIAAEHDGHGVLFPQPLSIRECLAKYCDLQSAPRRSDLKLLASYATDPTDQQFLQRLASKEGKKEFATKVTDAYLGLVDLLKLLPSIQIPLEHFVHMVPPIQTRFYTISSSASVHPQSIHLTVALTKADRPDGSSFEGLCSGYLAGCHDKLDADDSMIRVHIRPSTFRLPTDSSIPIIMIGPGTGIAPMRALLQERSHQRHVLQQGVGSNTLYFGCRTRLDDYIYQDELAAFQKAGDLDHLFVAFSREQNEKLYVQHLLKKNDAETWKLIDQEGAYVYVCGGVRMGNDVSEALKEIVVAHGVMTAEAAKQYLSQMSQKGRFVQELWA
jgi:NADPH-ferrihemoprotein reductase